MRDLINNAVEEYKTAFEECNIQQKWHSETIFRKGAPFLNGHFTLAIVGKMSSGKSTFINTLIGEDILPTGHFQTTSAITYIEHAEDPKMVVTFCDGHKQTFEGDTIKESLKGLVSVAPEYSSLPVNNINDLIAGGDTLEEILLKKFEIEQKTKTKSSEDLWTKYFETHPKSLLAEQVQIYFPLSPEFYGWQIIDTPGVGAIGGIQDETKRLFAKRDATGSKLVDAIIFLQRGDDNMEDSANVEFVENTFAQLTEEAKERLFFVLTHATTQKFRQMRDAILAKADEIYSQQYNISSERFTHIDSLMARFHRDLLANNADVSSFHPDEDDIPPYKGWNPQEWECMLELISPIKKELKNRGLSRNNDTMFSLMEEWGNFHTLKAIINKFVKDVKEQSAQDILDKIIEDYSLILAKYRKEIEILEGGENAIKSERETLKNKRIEYNNILNKLRRAAAIEPLLNQFAFVDERLDALSQKKSIDDVRIAYQNIMDEAKRKEKEIFEKLESSFRSFCQGFDSSDIVLGQIDFENLTQKAHEASTTKENVYREETYRTGGMSPKTKTRSVWTGTKDVTDQAKKLEKFKQLVKVESRKIRDSFFAQLKEKVKLLCDYVEKEIDTKMEELEARLKELENNLSNKEEELAILRKYASFISSILNKE